MSSLAFWTWLAIGVLTLGSAAVFLWFLRDLLRMAREARAAPPSHPPEA